MNMEVISKFAGLIPGQGNIDKCKAAIKTEKDAFLRLWDIELVKELAKQKGLEYETLELVPGSNDLQDIPIPFYELIKTISEKVSAVEIISFAKQHQVDYLDFEKRINNLKIFYKIR